MSRVLYWVEVWGNIVCPHYPRLPHHNTESKQLQVFPLPGSHYGHTGGTDQVRKHMRAVPGFLCMLRSWHLHVCWLRYNRKPSWCHRLCNEHAYHLRDIPCHSLWRPGSGFQTTTSVPPDREIWKALTTSVVLVVKWISVDNMSVARIIHVISAETITYIAGLIIAHTLHEVRDQTASNSSYSDLAIWAERLRFHSRATQVLFWSSKLITCAEAIHMALLCSPFSYLKILAFAFIGVCIWAFRVLML